MFAEEITDEVKQPVEERGFLSFYQVLFVMAFISGGAFLYVRSRRNNKVPSRFN